MIYYDIVMQGARLFNCSLQIIMKLFNISTSYFHKKKCFFILINTETNPRVKYSISFERAPGMVGSNKNIFFQAS
jgi:hypothetical protein